MEKKMFTSSKTILGLKLSYKLSRAELRNKLNFILNYMIVIGSTNFSHPNCQLVYIYFVKENNFKDKLYKLLFIVYISTRFALKVKNKIEYKFNCSIEKIIYKFLLNIASYLNSLQPLLAKYFMNLAVAEYHITNGFFQSVSSRIGEGSFVRFISMFVDINTIINNPNRLIKFFFDLSKILFFGFGRLLWRIIRLHIVTYILGALIIISVLIYKKIKLKNRKNFIKNKPKLHRNKLKNLIAQIMLPENIIAGTINILNYILICNIFPVGFHFICKNLKIYTYLRKTILTIFLTNSYFYSFSFDGLIKFLSASSTLKTIFKFHAITVGYRCLVRFVFLDQLKITEKLVITIYENPYIAGPFLITFLFALGTIYQWSIFFILINYTIEILVGFSIINTYKSCLAILIKTFYEIAVLYISIFTIKK